MDVTLQMIARVETPFKQRFGTPRQPGLVPAARGKIVFEPAFHNVDFLRGLEEFSHLWLTFVFDRNSNGYSPLVRPPRLGGNEKRGVFATRSPYRPNGIGLSAVKLEFIDFENVELTVSGVDLTDQTPLVDIRPYVSYTDSLVDASSGFASHSPIALPFQIDELCVPAWEAADQNSRAVISQTLALDPRPAYHEDPQRVYKVELCGYALGWSSKEGVITLCYMSKIKD